MKKTSKKIPLSRERILNMALTIIQKDGVSALSMRALAQSLGVEAMSLYNHIENRDDLLDGLLDMAISEFEVPNVEEDWREVLTKRGHMYRALFKKHPWSINLFESRANLSQSYLRYQDQVISNLMRNGLSLKLIFYALTSLQSFLYGFSTIEQSWTTKAEYSDLQKFKIDRIFKNNTFPGLISVVGYINNPQNKLDYNELFEFGLKMTLDGIERARTSSL